MDSPLDLVGEELNAVCFVMDYVELHFNGPILRALTKVSVVRGEQRSVVPGPGGRDALCEVIGSTVTDVDVRDDIAITLTLNSGHVVGIPLDVGSRNGPEAAHFVPDLEIAARLDLPRRIVSKWRQRFHKRRLLGLVDEARSGRLPGFSPSHRRRRQSPRV